MKMPIDRPKIRTGQYWKKKKGIHRHIIVITGSAGKGYVHTKRLTNPKIAHHVTRKDLWIYYELITEKEAYEEVQRHSI